MIVMFGYCFVLFFLLSGVWSRSLSFFAGDSDSGPYLFHLDCVCNFVAVCLTSVQFILQVKLCFYTIVRLLLEEFKISVKSSSSTRSL